MGRVREFLGPVCHSRKASRRLRQRACITLAKLIYAGKVQHISVGNRYDRAAWLLKRACLSSPKTAGCGDRDRDGIPDAFDACPKRAEDPDGHEDRDGCPDDDNDGDNVADHKDQCPGLWASTPNGCPRPGVRLGNAFTFETGSAAFDPSDPVVKKRLVSLVTMLKQNPRLDLVEVRGHARISQLNPASRPPIARKRARQIYKWLVAHGIAAKRLRWFGYASRLYNAPIADVVVAQRLPRRLSRRQVTESLKQLRQFVARCNRSNTSGSGRGRFTFYAEPDGTTTKPTVSGNLANSNRARCVSRYILKFAFPRAHTRTRIAFDLHVR